MDTSMFLPPQDGMTPLASASYKGNTSVAQLLLKARAKTDLQDKVKASA